MQAAEPIDIGATFEKSGEPFPWRRFFKYLGLSAVALFLVRQLIVGSGYNLSFALSPSMNTAVYRVSPSRGAPERGDLVVFHVPANEVFSGRVVKRVVGVEGDSIELRDNRLYVNGTDIGVVHAETSLGKPLTPQQSVIVPPRHIFVVGTHDRSFDSRYQEFGTINRGRVEGQAKELF